MNDRELRMALRDNDPSRAGMEVLGARFGKPVGRPGGHVHEIDFALRDEVGNTGARWRCGGHSISVELLSSVSRGDTACARCFPQGERQQVVYFIERDGLIKIGWTSDLDTRSAAIGGEVLATQPGNRMVEETLHRVFRASRRCGEWFERSGGLMDYIDSLTTE